MTPSVRRKTVPASPMNDVKPDIDTEDASLSTALNGESSTSFTTLRRSTRSSTGAGTITPSSSTTNLDLTRYAYNPVTPSRKRVKVEPREDVDNKLLVQTPMTKIKDDPDASARPPTPRSSSKKMPQLALDKPHKEPDRWREQYRLIEHMRKGIIAPVDNMSVCPSQLTPD